MHSSTRETLDHLVSVLAGRGVRVELFNLAATDIGKPAMVFVDAATVALRTPTVLPGPHPLAVYASIVGNPFKPKVKFLFVIGSYGWSGNTVETLAGMRPNLKVEVLNPVRFS